MSDDRDPSGDSETTPLSPSSGGRDGYGGAPSWSPTVEQQRGGGAVFAVGEVVAGRFRVLRFLGRGGMGQVFEAHDLELDETVAVKTLLPGGVGSPQALARFRREVRLARQVTHPNVCRVFDVFVHESGPGDPSTHSAGPVTVLSMELLRGETLAQRLRRGGRVAPDQAERIVRQVASALDAAHRKGIIHRDLKSANIMLVQGDGAEERVVVTDFGLAKVVVGDPAGETEQLSRDGVVGTPAYMAPEQVRGQPLTPAADLYALGVVMFEMLTGRQPFAGDTPLSAAVRRLSEPPPSPRQLVAELDLRWERVVLRCLEVDPSRRFSTAGDVVRALEGDASPFSPSARRGRLVVAGAAAAVVVIAAGGALVGRLWRPERVVVDGALEVAAHVELRPVVAVLGFRNLTGREEHAWLATALAEMLGCELGLGRTLRTVPGEAVARARLDLGLTEVEALASDTLTRLRRLVGNDLVVLGSYAVVGPPGAGRVRLDLQVQRTASGETLTSLTETGSEVELFELVERVGNHLRDRLGAGRLSEADSRGIRAAQSRDPQAVRLYAAGLSKLRAYETVAGVKLLEEAVRLDGDYALAHEALADALTGLGFGARAKAAAQRAFETAGELPEEQRLRIESLHAYLSGDLERAADLQMALWTVFRDDLAHGTRLVNVLVRAGRVADAEKAVAEMRGLPAPARDDPRVDLAEALTAGAAGDAERQLRAATLAADKGEAIGARGLVALASLRCGLALNQLGRVDEAVAATEKARDLRAADGNLGGVAEALNNLGMILFGQQDLERTRAVFEECLATHRRMGDHLGVARALNNLGVTLGRLGDAAGALKCYEESLAVSRGLGDRQQEATALGNVALARSTLGDLEGALETYQQALQMVRELGQARGEGWTLDSIGVAYARLGRLREARDAMEEGLAVRRRLGDRGGVLQSLTNLGGVLVHLGEAERAGEVLDEALATAREIGERHGEAYALAGQGTLLRLRDRLDEAEERLQAALALRLEMQQTAAVAHTRLALAALRVDRERFAEASALARAALAELRSVGAPEEEALTVLVRAEVEGGRRAVVGVEVERLRELADAVTSRDTRLTLAPALAAVLAADGQRAAAVASLATAAQEAQEAGFVDAVLGLRIEQARHTLAVGDTGAARDLLEGVRETAVRVGYLWFARRAGEELERIADGRGR